METVQKSYRSIHDMMICLPRSDDKFAVLLVLAAILAMLSSLVCFCRIGSTEAHLK